MAREVFGQDAQRPIKIGDDATAAMEWWMANWQLRNEENRIENNKEDEEEKDGMMKSEEILEGWLRRAAIFTMHRGADCIQEEDIMQVGKDYNE
jgi:hypothetical protein